eukprot:TRINITY_DN114914_c0_g1_i1.p1 TRINITY_DN114914_c0_g1~~TRINITY_DN114914_c0_g1_i1.p1  ORF type:complete len:585 (+),score=145.28 TRINITY_DN114914_c0_g1_i1:158-1912(+)
MGDDVCPHCGGTEFDYDRARGDTTCANPRCGAIITERDMVGEISFMQSGGKTVAAQKQVDWSGAGNAGGAWGTTNFEAAVAKGTVKIQSISDKLQLPVAIQEAGRRIYQLAVQMSFCPGRPTRLIAGACLYIVCRRNRTPHLLIDFSDALSVPVKKLGSIYVRLLQRLVGGDPRYAAALGNNKVEAPVLDPSVCLERFCRDLNLGLGSNKVQHTAMRLIQYMHRDWICVGRRPNGLCGAALLIAAYYHGIKCTAAEVAEAVRISITTLQVRLVEMQYTPLALMNREGFEKSDPLVALPADAAAASVPPCVRKRQRAEDKKLLALQDDDAALALEDAPSLKALSDKPHAKKARKTDAAKADAETPAASSSAVVAASGEETADAAAGDAPEPEAIAKGIADTLTSLVSASADQASKLDELLSLPKSEKSKGDAGTEKSKGAEATVAVSDKERADKKKMPKPPPVNVESLSDVEDDELDELYMLTEEEAAKKGDMWHEINKDYLEEWHIRAKESKRRADEAAAAAAAAATGDTTSSAGTTKKSRRGGRKARLGPAASVKDSVQQALFQRSRAMASVINAEAVEALFA